jgi:excisionase family DNA binding protein
MIVINNRIYLSLSECAEQLNVHYRTVHSWLEKHSLPSLNVVGRLMIAQDDLSSFLAKKQDRRKKGWRKAGKKNENA